MEFSKHQEQIFYFVTDGSGSAVVIAVAGSGKTTTIVEAARRIPATMACAFVAFNKSIAEELKTRLPQHVKSQTLNAMGYSAWLRHTGAKRLNVNSNKTRDIMKLMISWEDSQKYGAGVAKLVALAKSVGLVPQGMEHALAGLVRDTDQVWQDLIDHFDIDFEDGLEAAAIALARKVLARSIEIARQEIDFDDQLYMPVVSGARFYQNDFLFVDEAQDVNAVQRAMLKRALKPGGRLIAVGDPAQAIYGFRGADSNSIENIKQEFDAIELPLTISYRCPQAIVAEAQRFVSHIEASPTAPAGVVKWLDEYTHDFFTATDAVVCRNTAPLITMAYALMRKRVPVRVLGREIGQGLVALVKKMKAQTVDGLEERLEAYQERETAKFMAKGQEGKAEAIADKVSTVFVFIDALEENRRTISALIDNIEALFNDNARGVLTLCTIHKSKGLEFPRVFILEPELMPSKYARQAWQKKQERNIQYVAITRAKSELYYIGSKGLNSHIKGMTAIADANRESREKGERYQI